MQKLIKLSDEHYIVVDDSEIKEGDLCYDPEGSPGYNNIKYVVKCLRTAPDSYWNKYCKKITHSTQPFKEFTPKTINDMGIGYILLSEVEEAIYGYSVEKMAFESVICNGGLITTENETEVAVSYYHQGFKAHQELVKDKLFTIDNMQLAIQQAFLSGLERLEDFDKVEKMILENVSFPTEWDVEINEQGKIKLL